MHVAIRIMQKAIGRWLGGPAGRIHVLAGVEAFVIVALVTVSAWTLDDARRDAWGHARTVLENLTFALDRAVSRNFEHLDVSLLSIVTALKASGADRLTPAQQRALLSDPALSADYIDQVRILDRAGTTVADRNSTGAAGASKAGLEYFKVHQTYNQDNLFIGPPVRDPRDGRWRIALSRGLYTADGTFDGVVVAMLQVNRFAELMRRFELGQGGLAVVIHEDGTTIARAPAGGDEATPGVADFAARLQAGNFESFFSTSPASGEVRLNALSKVANAPFYVTTSINVDGVLAGWRRRAWVLGGLIGFLVVVSATAALLFAVELRRRRRLVSSAELTDARHRILAENSGDVLVLLGLDGCYRYVSESVTHVLGFDPAELLGTHFTAHVDAADHAAVQAALDDVKAGTDAVTVRYRCLRLDGQTLWMEARLRAARNPLTGLFEKVVANLRDISARKAAEETLDAAASALALLAATDGLTGLANRRHFDEVLEREWRRAARDQQPIALVMLDADLFKSYNDAYGHQKGDTVLRDIAECIRGQSRRPGDTSARYGGEEFAVILSATDHFGAIQVAEKIRYSVAAAEMPHSGSKTGTVTVSLGIASLIAGRGADWRDLLAAADAALYEAKRRGRNQVFCAEPTLEPIRIPSLSR